MRLHKTGHPIADTVSDKIGDLYDGDYAIAYGILRGADRYLRYQKSGNYFQVDRGFWEAGHFDGNYRCSFRGTQPSWASDSPQEDHGLELQPWKIFDGKTLICPPTPPVCEFFNINYTVWILKAIKQSTSRYEIRHKGYRDPLSFDGVSRLVTFNSTVALKALQLGIPVISDPDHSSVGSFTKAINHIDSYDREPLFRFCAAHQFKLDDKEKIEKIISYYLRREKCLIN